MKKLLNQLACLFLATATFLTACDKEDLPKPPPVVRPGQEGFFNVKVKASLTVGDVVYDSIPAALTILGWDRDGVLHRREVALSAGTNEVQLDKSFVRHQLTMNKWGASAERSLQKSEVSESTVYILSATKAAKRLSSEITYAFQDGAFQPYKKEEYRYDAQGRLQEISHFDVDPAVPGSALTLSSVDRLNYSGDRLESIELFDKSDGSDNILGFTEFSYDNSGKMVFKRTASGNDVYRYQIEHTSQQGTDIIRINTMGDGALGTGARVDVFFRNGNRIEEHTIAPNYPTTTKTYTFDNYINPYVHLKNPGIFFENTSKNNVKEISMGSATTLRHNYQYDNDGYITQVQKAEHNTSTGASRLILKTVYTY